MSKKEKFKSFISDAGQAAKSAIDKTKETATALMDQDNDGKVDIADLSIIKDSVSSAVKDGSEAALKFANDTIHHIETNLLRPITRETLNNADFVMSKLICVNERSKKYSGNDVTKDSIGFLSTEKGVEYVNIFWDSIDAFDITLLPNANSDFYYVDPSDRNKYIAIDNYFDFLRDARINELQVVAHDLGAKYFKVTYLEKKKTLTKKQSSFGVSVMGKGESNESSRSSEDYSVVKTAAESHFPGHEPQQPELEYLKNNKTIEGLITMRLKNDPITKQSLNFEFSSLNGLTARDAAKIDAVFKSLKCSGNATLESEAQNETRKSLQYDIEF
ncbi:MAG: hypothetical protein MR492_01320 [Clostridiales bacterium]|nr:hypothetical protein [Clostridiales bacterium]